MTGTNPLTYISEEQLFELISPKQAALLLRKALSEGFDPADDCERSSAELNGGQMLLMPSSLPQASGIKVLTLADGNPERGLPLIQGAYLLFEGDSLAPVAIIDGAGLTNLRTPALSLAGIYEPLVARAEAGDVEVAIFGTGVQARFHKRAVDSVLEGVAQADVTFISRTQPEDLESWVQAGSDEARAATAEADLVLCCTTSSEPILDVDDVSETAIIVALGSHTPGARELSGELVGSGQVIIEDLGAAKREAGDVIQAVGEGHVSWDDVLLFKDVAAGRVELDPTKRIIFKTTGMPWEDLALAHAAASSS